MNGRCDRCFIPTETTSGSYFNTQMICPTCSKKEVLHPDFKYAREVECNHVANGNYNFEGIGLPDDLK